MAIAEFLLQYTFPPQTLVISACAELAKRIVSGQSTTDVAGGKTRTVDSFMSVQDKSSEKKKEGKILVIVGYIFSCIIFR
jgi:DNA cross-link repair 1A protein